MCLGALVPGGAVAQDRFEIQVYDAETAPPLGVGVELHANYVALGTRATSPDGELATDKVTHLTLEPHLGLATWCELGAYLQTAIRPEGALEYAGVKLRFKARYPKRLADGLLGLAVNFEVSEVPATYEANVWSAEVRPIVDFRWDRLYASLNPIVGIDLAGPLAGRPQLGPTAKIAVTLIDKLQAGLEYYAGLGPVTAVARTSQQTHLLFAAFDFVHAFREGLNVDLNFAVGYNLAGNGERWVVKLIAGVGQ